jgi:YesN/AraC family two-component response regulator
MESEEGKGSRFIVVIPVDKDKLTNFIIVEPEDLLGPLNPLIKELPSIEEQNDNRKIGSQKENLPLILLVEDNADIRIFLRNILEDKYNIEEAENGSEGLTKALATLPDIIISDVMMPEMDGYQFTNAIKTDERTSHIPVILLTSLTSTDSIIKGLENDADEYITKPFNDQILQLKVHNLIQSRQKLKLKYLQYVELAAQKRESIELEPAKVEIPDTEQLFLNKLMAIIEKNMEESEFGVKQFSSEVGMEASVFHRKLKALISQSPGEFIRTIRMKRAAQLLDNKSLSIADVAYMVGFGNNTNYFSTAFRKHFGKSPKEFQNS